MEKFPTLQLYGKHVNKITHNTMEMSPFSSINDTIICEMVFSLSYSNDSFVSCGCNWTIAKYLSTWKHNYLWPNHAQNRENGQHKRRNFVNWKEDDGKLMQLLYMFSRYVRVYNRLRIFLCTHFTVPSSYSEFQFSFFYLIFALCDFLLQSFSREIENATCTVARRRYHKVFNNWNNWT